MNTWHLLLRGVIVGPLLWTWALGAEPVAGEGESGSNSIFVGDVPEALWTLAAFLLLWLILWKMAWKPLLAALHAREEHIQKQIDDAKKVREEAEAVLAGYRQKLSEAEQQGRQIVEQHVKTAEQEADQIIQKAQENIEAMRVRLETEIERSRRQAQKELLEQSGQIIFELGRQILGRSIDTSDNQRLIAEAIERLGHEQRQRHMEERLPETDDRTAEGTAQTPNGTDA